MACREVLLTLYRKGLINYLLEYMMEITKSVISRFLSFLSIKLL